MFAFLLSPLVATLRPHFDLSKTRLETLAVLLAGLANCRTVNLSHLASQFSGTALHASNYRRVQRFFQHVRLDGDVVAVLIVHLLNLARPKLLALDRTNWKLGAKDVNILVPAIVTRRFRVPLMWVSLDHPGNSSPAQRIGLMRRYLRLFGACSIDALLADREFIGTEWLECLNENNIPFVVRLRENMHLCTEDGRLHQFRTLLRKSRQGAWTGWLSTMAREPDNRLRFAAKRIKGGEALIVATNIDATRRALNLYRKRSGIECLFADAKTRGFNSEDTHITNPAKLATLLAVIALTVTWAYRCATRVMGRTAIRRKSHNRRTKSWFRTGLDALRRWIIHNPENALLAWRQTCPKRPIKQLALRCVVYRGGKIIPKS